MPGRERRHLLTFWRADQALANIRDGRLYRATHNRFEAYCRERWFFDRRHVYHLIDAADVVNDLKMSSIDDIPTNEAQTRPLVPLTEEQRVEAWQAAIENAPNARMCSARQTK